MDSIVAIMTPLTSPPPASFSKKVGLLPGAASHVRRGLFGMDGLYDEEVSRRIDIKLEDLVRNAAKALGELMLTGERLETRYINYDTLAVTEEKRRQIEESKPHVEESFVQTIAAHTSSHVFERVESCRIRHAVCNRLRAMASDTSSAPPHFVTLLSRMITEAIEDTDVFNNRGSTPKGLRVDKVSFRIFPGFTFDALGVRRLAMQFDLCSKRPDNVDYEGFIDDAELCSQDNHNSDLLEERPCEYYFNGDPEYEGPFEEGFHCLNGQPLGESVITARTVEDGVMFMAVARKTLEEKGVQIRSARYMELCYQDRPTDDYHWYVKDTPMNRYSIPTEASESTPAFVLEGALPFMRRHNGPSGQFARFTLLIPFE